MARFPYNDKIINIKNSRLEIIYFDQQYLHKIDIDKYLISSKLKSIKKQNYKNSFKRKLLRKHNTYQPEDLIFIYIYTNLKKHLLR